MIVQILAFFVAYSSAATLNPCDTDFQEAHYAHMEYSLTLNGGTWQDGKRTGILHHYRTMNHNGNDVTDPIRIEDVAVRENITFSCANSEKGNTVYITLYHSDGSPFRNRAFLYPDFATIGWANWEMRSIPPSCTKLAEGYFENDEGDRISFGISNRIVQSFLEIPSWTRYMSCSEGGKLEFNGLTGGTTEEVRKFDSAGTYDVAKGEVVYHGKTYRRSTQVIRIKK